METINKLKALLANLWIAFFDCRNAHWNIQAINFMDLHKFFESLYQMAEDQADDVAERIRQLGEFSPKMMGEFLSLKTIEEVPEILSDPQTAIDHLLNIFTQIDTQIIEIMQDLGKDEATRNLLAGMAQDIEKKMWFLRSYK
jgi:starvation-inducible DNA-binding protein